MITACQPEPSALLSDESIANFSATAVSNATRQAANADERLEIRWFVGLGDDLTDKQAQILQSLADQYNKSQYDSWLQLIIAPEDEALQILQTAQANNRLPDLIGPIGLSEANYFYNDWLDLRPYLPTDAYSVQSLALYERNGRLEGVPLTLYPSFIYYNRQAFDRANLAYPPQQFGEPYADGEPWDFDKLTELALKLTFDSAGYGAETAVFNPDDIAQFGYINQWTDTVREGVVPFGAGALIDDNGNATLPDAWRDGIRWTYSAMWQQRFYPHQDDQFSHLFANANTFRSGHVAIAHAPLWFTCCMGNTDFEWDIAVVPSYQGQQTAKLHADGFRIFADSPNPDATAQVLNWLMTDGYMDLLLAYGGIPAQPEQIDFMIDQLDAFYPYNINWQVALDSLAYADSPHHQAYLPNYEQAIQAETLFWSLLETDPALDIEAKMDEFVRHLQLIYEE